MLKKNSYSKIAKLYAVAADYSKAIKSMDKRMQEHVEELTDNRDFGTIIQINEAFPSTCLADGTDFKRKKLGNKEQMVWKTIRNRKRLHC